MCQLVLGWDRWKLPDGSLSRPARQLELVPFVSLFCLLQVVTVGLMCARLCGSSLKAQPRLILASAPGRALVIRMLLRGLPGLVVEPVWEPCWPALGWREDSHQAVRGGSSMLLTSLWQVELQGQRGGQTGGHRREREGFGRGRWGGDWGTVKRPPQWLLQAGDLN